MTNEIIIQENSLAAVAAGLNDKLKVCELLCKSGMVPAHYKTPQAVFAAVMRGQELGLSPMQSLEAFNVIQGKVVMNAAGLQALCISHTGRFEVIEESDDACEIKATRASNGWSQTYRFTIDEAGKMGLLGKDNWKRMKAWMLYARCVSVLCRRGWADILAGLYSAEEMQDSTEPRARLIKADVVTVATEEIQEPQAEDAPQTPEPDVYTYDLEKLWASPLCDTEEKKAKYGNWLRNNFAPRKRGNFLIVDQLIPGLEFCLVREEQEPESQDIDAPDWLTSKVV